MSRVLESLRTALAGRYTIERELGRGGNATVYLAHDIKHDRQVALKVLSPELAHTVRTERFLREIQIAARLTHPHILMLIDSGEADGFLYYVMPYVAGESLRERLNREQQLRVEDALRINQDVAEALGYAHAHGVMHRDIKPENILLSEGGAVVADFGIARALSAAGGETASESGLVAGTPAYMSPEQASGGSEVDGRSDIYSLGCVLYEMLAGHVPYAGETAQEILAHHALDPIPSLRAARPGVPRTVEGAIVKALAKVPADRFATAAEFAGALAGPRRRLPVYGAIGLLVLVGAAIVAQRTLLRAPPEQSVAVLPFVNLSGDSAQEYFSDGMSEELINALAHVHRLSVPARTSSFAFKGKSTDIKTIGRQLGVAHVLEGSVRRAGSLLRVTAQLISVGNGYHVWSENYEREIRSARDVFAVQDELSRAIVAALRVSLGEDRATPVAPVSTENLAAYDDYLRGRFYWNRATRADLLKAIEYFRSAIARDSGFARAYSGLADAYIRAAADRWIPQASAYRNAKAAASRALALDSTLAEAHTSLARIRTQFENDWPGAEQEFERAIRADPRYGLAHSWYSGLLSQRQRHDQAIAEGRLGLVLDPLSRTALWAVARNYRAAGQYDSAIAYSRHLVLLQPDWAIAHEGLASSYALKKMYQEALVEYRAELALDSNSPSAAFALSRIIGIQVRAGNRPEALNTMRRLLEASRHSSADPRVWATQAAAYTALGNKDSAFAALERARRGGYQFQPLTSPAWDSLRSDPRFAEFLKRLGRER